MKVTRVTEEWQKAGIYYVRTQAMVLGFQMPLEIEFADDKPQDQYVLVSEGNQPISACRIRKVDDTTGKIERVATLEEYRGQHYGTDEILESEKWLKEQGVNKILINSREAVLGFYEKLGYVPDYAQRSGSGTFSCVMTYKDI